MVVDLRAMGANGAGSKGEIKADGMARLRRDLLRRFA
jgi:hypothetical protein